MRTAYLDNNIFIDIENNIYSKEELIIAVDKRISELYYSAAHLQEANEITGINREKMLEKRFKTISFITDNNYLFQELHSNEVRGLKENPSNVFRTINEVSFAQNAMKTMMNLISEEQKKELRKQLNIETSKINNYNPTEIIEHINAKSDLFGGFSFVEVIEKAIELHPQGKEFGLHNRFAGVFEFLDLIGYWKDKYTEKSNYARLWDSNHAYFGCFMDYFISNDKKTVNKTKVVYELYEIETKIVSFK